MCNALSYKTNFSTIFDYFPSLETDGWDDGYDFQGVYTLVYAWCAQPVVLMEDNLLKLKLFEWGLIAPYMNTAEAVKKNRPWMVNARAEKITEPKAYWYKIKNQRCLVPVNGIYEHRRVRGMKNKVPYYISCKGREMFCLPALYNYVPDKETGEMKGTFAVVTRAANKLMEQIHNDGENRFRMPLFIPKDMEEKWLDPALSFEQIKDILNYELPAAKLEAWPVFTVQSGKMRPDCQPANAPYSWPGLPPLGTDEVGGQQSLF